MRTHYNTKTHAVTLVSQTYEIGSMIFGSQDVQQIFAIGIPHELGRNKPYAKVIKLSKIKAIYKRLKTRRERIAVWAFIKNFEQEDDYNTQREISKIY